MSTTAPSLSRRTLCLSLASVAGAAALPLATAGTAEAATVARAISSVHVRSRATSRSRSLGVLAKGQRVTLRGARHGFWQPVIYRGRRAWVAARYLTRGSVTSSIAAPVPKPARLARPVPEVSRVAMPTGVVANGRAVALEVRANFPQVTTMYGRRNSPGSDHNSGRAVDIMLPDYRANAALGTAIAEHMRANAARLGITYVIWNQRIWSVRRNAEGWRPMASRGSDNANHKNHVHVSVR